MPLLDLFQPPLSQRYHWESFQSNWATRLADAITAILPPEFHAEEHRRFPDSFEVRVFWTATLAVGNPLPVLPLRLTGDLFAPVNFEAAYQEACQRRRMA